MSQALEDIRKQIDALDDRIHDLLMERADLIVSVSEEKKKGNIPVVQPAREAVMLRRLLGRHRGPLPEAAIVGIWRELVGAVSLLQTGLKVAVSQGDDHGFCWDMAKNYFGTVLPMSRVVSPMLAISALKEGDASFAVVPWPVDGDNQPWWSFLNSGEPDRMRIVCALPYGSYPLPATAIKNRALVVAKTDFSKSGDDMSFVIAELDSSVSRGKIFDSFKTEGMQSVSLFSRLSGAPGASNLHLVEVAGFVADQDPRLDALKARFTEHNIKLQCIGGYPVPPVYKPLNLLGDVAAEPSS